MLRDLQGVWLEEEEDIKHMVSEYYHDLFIDNGVEKYAITEFTFLAVLLKEKISLNGPFKIEEIKNALFDMSLWKASGLDGLPGSFYQNAQDIVGNTLCQTTDWFWRSFENLEFINKTSICLIPKIEKL